MNRKLTFPKTLPNLYPLSFPAGVSDVLVRESREHSIAMLARLHTTIQPHTGVTPEVDGVNIRQESMSILISIG